VSTITSLTGTVLDPFDTSDLDETCTLVPAGASRREALPCHTVNPDLWFAESPADVETAKALCGPCPLRAACLSGALERREPWGVWGGELVLSGVVVPRKRPRGRPRKDEIAA
jgi:WhiB family redox-sensing transcriptional regulator